MTAEESTQSTRERLLRKKNTWECGDEKEDRQDHPQVPSHSDEIRESECYEEEDLQLWGVSQSQESEFFPLSTVLNACHFEAVLHLSKQGKKNG